MVENIWFIIIVTIVLIILSTDPKSYAAGTQENQLNMLFSNASDGQEVLRTFTWVLIALFYIITLLLSYYG